MNSIGFSILRALVMMSYLQYLHYFLQFLFLLHLSVTSKIFLAFCSLEASNSMFDSFIQRAILIIYLQKPINTVKHQEEGEIIL